MTFALALLIALLIGGTIQFWFKYAIVGVILAFHLLMLFGVIGFMTWIFYIFIGSWAFLVVPGGWFLFFLHTRPRRQKLPKARNYQELLKRERMERLGY